MRLSNRDKKLSRSNIIILSLYIISIFISINNVLSATDVSQENLTLEQINAMEGIKAKTDLTLQRKAAAQNFWRVYTNTTQSPTYTPSTKNAISNQMNPDTINDTMVSNSDAPQTDAGKVMPKSSDAAMPNIKQENSQPNNNDMKTANSQSNNFMGVPISAANLTAMLIIFIVITGVSILAYIYLIKTG